MPSERRYLIASSLARLIQKERGLGSRTVEGYFAPQPGRRQVVRIEDGSAQLILITTAEGGSAEEERADVPRAHAEALLDVAAGKLAFARGRMPLPGGREALLDRFMAPGRIDLVTVAFEDAEQAGRFQAPAWFGPEVTNEGGFEAGSLALNGVPEVGDLTVSNAGLEALLDALEQRFGGLRPAAAPPRRAMPPSPTVVAPTPAPTPLATPQAPAEEARPAAPAEASIPDEVIANLARSLAPRRL